MSTEKKISFHTWEETLFEKPGKTLGHADYKTFWNEFIDYTLRSYSLEYSYWPDKDDKYLLVGEGVKLAEPKEVAEKMYEKTGKEMGYVGKRDYFNDVACYLIGLQHKKVVLTIA